MILLDAILHEAINPALALLPGPMDTKEARVQMLAIGMQESEFLKRCQVLPGGGRGPAHGFWQMERGGGVLGVLTHFASRFHAASICKARGVNPDSVAVWEALEKDDVLAAAFARLLLWTDGLRMPGINDADGAWALYARVWRPGKPHPEKWPANHAAARSQVLS